LNQLAASDGCPLHRGFRRHASGDRQHQILGYDESFA